MYKLNKENMATVMSTVKDFEKHILQEAIKNLISGTEMNPFTQDLLSSYGIIEYTNTASHPFTTDRTLNDRAPEYNTTGKFTISNFDTPITHQYEWQQDIENILSTQIAPHDASLAISLGFATKQINELGLADGSIRICPMPNFLFDTRALKFASIDAEVGEHVKMFTCMNLGLVNFIERVSKNVASNKNTYVLIVNGTTNGIFSGNKVGCVRFVEIPNDNAYWNTTKEDAPSYTGAGGGRMYS